MNTEAINLEMRSQLVQAIRGKIQGWNVTQIEAAERLGITQPRLNALLRDRIANFSLDTLINLAHEAEIQVKLDIVEGDTMTAEEEIRAIAERHGITFERSALDDYCETITRLSDDDVETDAVEDLIVAIGRAGVHDDKALTLLHARYLNEIGDQRAAVA